MFCYTYVTCLVYCMWWREHWTGHGRPIYSSNLPGLLQRLIAFTLCPTSSFSITVVSIAYCCGAIGATFLRSLQSEDQLIPQSVEWKERALSISGVFLWWEACCSFLCLIDQHLPTQRPSCLRNDCPSLLTGSHFSSIPLLLRRLKK